jgi:hypothetical protein
LRHLVESQGDLDAELRSAICIYLVGECRDGATIGALAQLTLGGRTPTEEVEHVSEAVSGLVHAGLVMEGKTVYPVVTDGTVASDEIAATCIESSGGSNGG